MSSIWSLASAMILTFISCACSPNRLQEDTEDIILIAGKLGITVPVEADLLVASIEPIPDFQYEIVILRVRMSRDQFEEFVEDHQLEPTSWDVVPEGPFQDPPQWWSPTSSEQNYVRRRPNAGVTQKAVWSEGYLYFHHVKQ